MGFDLPTLLGTSAGAVTALSGIYAAYRHVRYGIQTKKDKERQDLLDKANEELAKVETKLREKISSLEQEFETHKTNLAKDLDYMKASYNAEVKILGEKIEDLRQDLNSQHSQMVALLTKLVSKS